MDRTEVLEPGLRRLVAPNPSPMTERGTNTYLLGAEELVVVDPGPEDPEHLDAIMEAGDGVPIARILVTHAHLDHSGLASRLSRRTGAPVAAFGDCHAGRSDAMKDLTGIGDGPGLDRAFAPDEFLSDGSGLSGAGWRIEAIWTPGHLGNHLAFLWNGVAFCGDLVMGWSSSVVSPPEGDLTQFMASCRKLARRRPRILYPGHGAPIVEPRARIEQILSHRDAREAQILQALADGPLSAREIARCLYTEIEPGLLAAAERTVLAHLIDLGNRALAEPVGRPSITTQYTRR